MKNTMIQYIWWEKNFTQRANRKEAEELRPEIKDWPRGNWQFWKFTSHGIMEVEKIKSDLDNNPEYIVTMAKMLLGG